MASRPSAPSLETLRDPETKGFYGYRVVDSLTVELCATFATADSLTVPGGSGAPSLFWKHPRGRHCFTPPLKEGATPAPRARD